MATPEALLRAKFKKLKKTRGRNGTTEYRVCCPFCGDDKGFKLYINFEKGVYNCYRDVTHRGTVKSLFGDIARQFAGRIQTEQERLQPLPEKMESPGYMIPVDQVDDESAPIQYLTVTRKRVFNPRELYRSWGVMYCAQGKEFYLGDTSFNTTNTLVFPIWMFNKLVGWQARLLYDPKSLTLEECAGFGFRKDEDGDYLLPPKYYTSKMSKGRVLYNFDLARKYNYVVITEGVFDAISVGGPAVATFGTGISEYQMRLIKEYWDSAIILLDPEGTDAATTELITDLYKSIPVVWVKLVGYKDPGDTPRHMIWGQITATINHMHKVSSNSIAKFADTIPMPTVYNRIG